MAKQFGRISKGVKLRLQSLDGAVGGQAYASQRVQLLIQDQGGLHLENIAVGFVLPPGDRIGFSC